MPTRTVLTSHQLRRAPGRAKAAAAAAPVVITTRGRPTHVLLTLEHFSQLAGGPLNAVDLLAMPVDNDVEFNPEPIGDLTKPADLR